MKQTKAQLIVENQRLKALFKIFQDYMGLRTPLDQPNDPSAAMVNKCVRALEGLEPLESVPFADEDIQRMVAGFKCYLIKTRPYWGRGLHIPDDYLRGPG